MGVDLYTDSTYTPENTVTKLTFWAQLFEGEFKPRGKTLNIHVIPSSENTSGLSNFFIEEHFKETQVRKPEMTAQINLQGGKPKRWFKI